MPSSVREMIEALPRERGLLEVVTEHAGRDALGGAVLAAVQTELGATAAWVHLVDTAGALFLAGEHGLPEGVAPKLMQLSVNALELAARAVRSGKPEELDSTRLGAAAPSDACIMRLLSSRRLHSIPLRHLDTTLGALSYASSTTAEVSDENVHAVSALVSLAVLLRNIHAEKDVLLRANVKELAAMATQTERFAQIIDSAPDGMVFVDAATGHLVASESFAELLGQSVVPEKGVAQKIGIVCSPDGLPLTIDELPSTRALEGKATPGRELLIVRRDGKRIPVTERALPVRDSDKNTIGAIVLFRDITAQKELDRLREEFAAMVAHDLRSPIQAILLQLSILRRTVEEGKTPPLLAFDRMALSGARLAQMANDLLESSRVELSRVHLDKVKLDVVEAVHELVDRMRPTLGDHAVVCEVRGRPPAALLDPTRLDEILTNILENAAKYSADGTIIRVVVGASDDGASADGVEIAVQDQGSGIAPDEIPKLFDRFYQTKRARERKTGLGLGLYITKGFVDAHGGRVRVESTVQRGSTFRLWFPAAPPGEQTAPPPSP